MSDQCQMVIVRVRLNILHLFDSEADVGDAALILRPTANIDLADLRHHWRIGRQIMLNADSDVATRGKNVRQKRILGEFDGIAVAEDRDRQTDHAGVRLHFLVAPYRNIDLYLTVIARRIVKRDRLVSDGPFAGGKITRSNQHAQRKQNPNSTFHISSSTYRPLWGPRSLRDSAAPFSFR